MGFALREMKVPLLCFPDENLIHTELSFELKDTIRVKSDDYTNASTGVY